MRDRINPGEFVQHPPLQLAVGFDTRRNLMAGAVAEPDRTPARLAVPVKAAQSPSTLHRLFGHRKRQDQVAHPQGGPGCLHSHAGVQFPGIDADHGFVGNRFARRRGQLNLTSSPRLKPGDSDPHEPAFLLHSATAS